MNMAELLLILLMLISQNSAKLLTSSISLDIDILSLTKCSNNNYPVEIFNLAVQINEGELILNGTLSTAVDLTSPVKATVTMEKHEAGIWIKIPCVKQMGSCTYSDLCVYGVPQNKSCPRQFIDNDVPCRCPFPKGTYIIYPSIKLPMKSHGLASLYAGKYWANIVLSQDVNLACYNAYFNVYDKTNEMAYVNSLYNDIHPFVELVR